MGPDMALMTPLAWSHPNTAHAQVITNSTRLFSTVPPTVMCLAAVGLPPSSRILSGE